MVGPFSTYAFFAFGGCTSNLAEMPSGPLALGLFNLDKAFLSSASPIGALSACVTLLLFILGIFSRNWLGKNLLNFSGQKGSGEVLRFCSS